MRAHTHAAVDGSETGCELRVGAGDGVRRRFEEKLRNGKNCMKSVRVFIKSISIAQRIVNSSGCSTTERSPMQHCVCVCMCP